MSLSEDVLVPRMMQLDLWGLVSEVVEGRPEVRGRRPKQKQARKAVDATFDQQLELLLRFPDDVAEDVSTHLASAEEIDAVRNFTDAEVILIAHMLIEDALTIISRDIVNQEAYQEAFDWIMEVDPVEVIGKKMHPSTDDMLNAEIYSIPIREAVFSFEWCCRVVQEDADIYRESVARIEAKRHRDFSRNLKRSKPVSTLNPLH